MNQFDRIMLTAFATITDTFGEVATWIPADGSERISGKVLYKDPSKTDEIGRLGGVSAEIETMPALPFIEYYQETYPGLRESVAAGNHEVIEINSLQYVIQAVPTLWDGKTYKAYIQEI